MKTHNISTNRKTNFIDRAFLSKIGDSLYLNSEVRAVRLEIKFKDNTKLEYRRHEFLDEVERDMENIDNSMEDKDED